jgi:hypothetical protein
VPSDTSHACCFFPSPHRTPSIPTPLVHFDVDYEACKIPRCFAEWNIERFAGFPSL